MAYFRCGQGAGGNELKILITTTDTSLYGQTITISKGGSTVGTTTFDNTGNAEYTVDEAGLYTVSCGGASESVLVEDEYEVSLSAIPDGSTVLPVNDIQTWLNCAGIFNKTTYTTISDVLADTTTLLALINSNNAVDYMVRSHDWCDDVCADATAMTYIGANNYAADTLLADDNPNLVPTMTSDTTPSGTCISNGADSGRQAYKAFDDSDTTFHSITGTISAYYLGYTFPSAKIVKSASILADSYNASYYYDVAIYAGDSISNLTKISDTVRIQANQGVGTRKTFTIMGDTSYSMYVLKIEDSNASNTNGNNWALFVYDIKLFGNDYTNSWLDAICNSTYFESVLNVKVPTMTSNTTPSGEVLISDCYSQVYDGYYAFDGNDSSNWNSANSGTTEYGKWIGYHFTSSVRIYKISYYTTSVNYIPKQIKAQSSQNGSTWGDAWDGTYPLQNVSSVQQLCAAYNGSGAPYFRIALGTSYGNKNNDYVIHTLQFYGRSAS